jgi:hypothetical protein
MIEDGTSDLKQLIGLLLKIFDVEAFTRGIVKRERMEDSELRSGGRKRSPIL